MKIGPNTLDNYFGPRSSHKLSSSSMQFQNKIFSLKVFKVGLFIFLFNYIDTRLFQKGPQGQSGLEQDMSSQLCPSEYRSSFAVEGMEGARAPWISQDQNQSFLLEIQTEDKLLPSFLSFKSPSKINQEIKQSLVEVGLLQTI